MAKFKIMIFSVKGTGHINPLLPILRELIKTDQVEIIVYATEGSRNKIESTGAQFRSYKDDEVEWNEFDRISDNPNPNKMRFIYCRILTNIAPKNMIYISKEIDKEQPGLIMHDFLAIYMIWILSYYKKSYEKAKGLTAEKAARLEFVPKKPLPPVVIFYPSFVTCKGVFPNKVEMEFFPKMKVGLSSLWVFLRLLLTELRICFRFGLSLSHLKTTPTTIRDFVQSCLVAVLPELQTRAHLFDQKLFKFVGSTVDENYFDPRLLNDELYNNILSQFTLKFNNDHLYLKNQINDNNQQENNKLIFASLGTQFNNVFKIYKTIVDGFKEFDEEPSEDKHSSLRLNNLTVIVSTGDKVYAEFETLISSKKYELPKNIILVKTAPQLEILKRASLFVTHCGMNSTSESVHFGVPMICIPLSVDQPFVAHRVADELGFGIILNKNTVTSSEIRRAAHKILNDSSYETRIKRFSQISRQTNGTKNASKFLLDIIEKEKPLNF